MDLVVVEEEEKGEVVIVTTTSVTVNPMPMTMTTTQEKSQSLKPTENNTQMMKKEIDHLEAVEEVDPEAAEMEMEPEEEARVEENLVAKQEAVFIHKKIRLLKNTVLELI